MIISNNESLKIKLFMGYLITSDIRMYLKQSSIWKEAKITETAISRDLLETHFQNKDYIGKYLKQEHVTLKELRAYENSIFQSLLNYCAELSPETHLKIYLFPQVFIT
jgi:hypothetical protein